MDLREFHPGLWLTELVLDDFDVRGAVLVGAERVLVWDTLSHPRDMAEVAQLAGDKPIYVAYSHADWDHCWGTAGLNPTLIIARKACAARFASGEVAREFADKQAADPGLWDEVRLIPPNLTFTCALALDLGGLVVTLIPLSGHTADCLVAFIPSLGVLLAGDTIETPLPYLSANSPLMLRYWIRELERWQADTRIQTVIPAHGEIGDASLIAHNVRYLTALQSGETPDVPAEMTTFYVETHARNLALMRSRQ